MRHPRIIIAGIGLAAVAAVGGVTAASAGGSTASSPLRQPGRHGGDGAHRASECRRHERDHPGQRPWPPPVLLPARHCGEVVCHRKPGRLWPPLTSAAPTAAGGNGKLSVLNDVNGHQVTYNGHPLYTFAGDHAGQVTGQGVQNFFVATPAYPDHRVLRASRTGPCRSVRQQFRLLTPSANPSAGPPTPRAEPADEGRRGYDGPPVTSAPSGHPQQRPQTGRHDSHQTRISRPAGAPGAGRARARVAPPPTVAALAAGGVTQRAGLTASFAVLGHLRWLCILAAIVLESVSMAAFAIMLRRLLAAGDASVGVRPMLATAYAANAVSVSVPLAGPGLATGFIFRRFTRQGADAPLAGWSLVAGGWPPRPPQPSSWPAAGWRPGKSWSQRSPFRRRARRSGPGYGRRSHTPAAAARHARTARRMDATARVQAAAPGRRRSPPDHPGLG